MKLKTRSILLGALAYVLYATAGYAESMSGAVGTETATCGMLTEARSVAMTLADADGNMSDNNIRSYEEPMYFRAGYARILPDIAIAQARAGCPDEAVATAAAIKKTALKLEATGHMAIALAELGNTKRAIEIEKTIDGELPHEAREDIRYSIARAMIQKGELQEAKVLVQDIETPPNYDEKPFNMIVRFQIEAGDLAGAIETVRSLPEEMLDKINEENAWLDIAREQLRRGDLRSAKKVYSNLSSSDFVLSSIVEAYSAVGMIKEARKAQGRIGDKNRRMYALIRIAVASSERGLREGARQNLSEAKKIAGTFKSRDSRGPAFSHIAEAQAKIGDVAEAIQTAGQTDYKNIALKHVIEQQAKAGDVDGALQTLSRVDNLFQKSEFGPIAVAAGRQGDWGRAVKLAIKIDNDSVKLRTVSAIAALPVPEKVFPEWIKLAETFRLESFGAMSVQFFTASMVRAGLRDAALEYAKSQHPAHKRARALIGIANGLLGVIGEPGDLKEFRVRSKAA